MMRAFPPFVLAFALLIASGGSSAAAQQTADAADSTDAEWVELKGGLKVQDLVVGDGNQARRGLMVQVRYAGWLEDGTVFDSNADAPAPFAFVLGDGRVIKGWERGVDGMRVGGKRKLWIPSKLGYGKRGAGNRIPPDADLTFEIVLLAVTPAPR